MEIPKSFKLMGRTIKVEYLPMLNFKDGAVGMAYHRSHRVGIQPDCPEYPRTKEDIEQTFLHELTHHILFAMGETKINDNEKFVDMFAGFLHQAITTMEYEA